MTITVAKARNEYTANPAQTIFNYTFKIFSITDLNVYITPAGQEANDSTDLTTAYTVSGVGVPAGGSITLTVGATVNDLVTIVSNVPSSRTTDYQSNGDFRPSVVNDDFDRVVSIAKKIEDTSNRTLVLPQSQQDPKPLSLPNPVARKYLRWKDDLSGVENATLADVDPVDLDLFLINDLSQAYTFTTVAAYKAFTTAFPVGKVVHLLDRGAEFTVIAGTGTANTFNIIASDQVSQSIDLIIKNGVADIAEFGAITGGIVDNTAVFTQAQTVGDSILVPPGLWLINNITITKPIKFLPGAIVKGSGIEITGKITGEGQIFQSDIDFYSNYPSSFIVDPDIKIQGQDRIMIDWFGAEKVFDKDLIKSIPNGANAVAQAFRAATGDYIADVARPGDFIGEYVNNNIGLATGYYNIASQIKWSAQVSGDDYRTSGNGIIGTGVSTSYLILSELKFGFGESGVHISRFTGQINTFKDFKVEVYAPQEGANKFLGEHPAALYFSSGDSMQINNVWAAGCQIGVDAAEGFLRNGVGIQFASVIDVQGSNVFSENCLYNYGVYSSVVNIANLVSFASKEAFVIFGIPNEAFSYPQDAAGTTNSQLNMTGGDIHACFNDGILAIEKGANIKMSNFRCNGTGESAGPATGRSFISAINASSISGEIRGFTITDFTKSLVRSKDDANLGTTKRKLSLEGGSVEGITTTTTTDKPGIISSSESSALDNNVSFTKTAVDVCRVQIFDFNGRIDVDDIALSEFRGASDSGVDRQLFQLRSGSGRMSNVSRTDENTQAIVQYGFVAAGNMQVDLLSSDLVNITRSIGGAGTSTMIDVIAFV